jgi:hypothetical protein
MGEHIDRSKAQAMCQDPAYRAKARNALELYRRTQGSSGK